MVPVSRRRKPRLAAVANLTKAPQGLPPAEATTSALSDSPAPAFGAELPLSECLLSLALGLRWSQPLSLQPPAGTPSATGKLCTSSHQVHALILIRTTKAPVPDL